MNMIVNYKSIEFDDFESTFSQQSYVSDPEHIRLVWDNLKSDGYISSLGYITDKATKVIQDEKGKFNLPYYLS